MAGNLWTRSDDRKKKKRKKRGFVVQFHEQVVAIISQCRNSAEA